MSAFSAAMATWKRQRWLPASLWTAALLVVVLYGAYLRLDGLVSKYGPFERPGWLVSLQGTIAATREAVVPVGWTWAKVPDPYVGSDPVNYLKFAREMQGFYQAHVREPLYLVTIRAFLPLVDNQDVAVSFASAFGSTIAIVATFLLGWAIRSRPVGLIAAWLVAIEGELVAWAPDGWRDDLFTAAVAFCAWAALVFHRRRSWRTAIVFGVVGGLAILTRITSLTFLLPAGLLLLATGERRQWRDTARKVGGAAGVAALIAGPYLFNCYLATGDPLYAINAHTRYYRSSEGLPSNTRMSAVAYTTGKFRQAPIGQFDTAVRGLFVHPFTTKFRGFPTFPSWFGPTLAWLAAIALFIWLWSPSGRLTLVILITSLTPYMLTWALRGGVEWRFTMHAYPFYLVGSVATVALLLDAVRAARPAQLRGWINERGTWLTVGIRSAVGIAIVSAAAGWNYLGPLLIATESLEAGASTSVIAAQNDGIFFREGWSALSTSGAVTSRFATTTASALRIPLPERRPYHLVLRIDPLPSAAAAPTRLEVRLKNQSLGTLDLVLDPTRVGSYTLRIPAELAGDGLTPLTFAAPSVRPAGDLAAIHPGLQPDTPVAFRLWHVRLTPDAAMPR